MWPYLRVSLLWLILFISTTYGFKFSSPEGLTLVRKILQEALPFDPHDYQLEGVCKVLDGIDLIAVTPTGSGKTGFLFMFIIVVLAIVKTPELCPTVKFPTNPLLIVICPTNYLEEQMVRFKSCRFHNLSG